MPSDPGMAGDTCIFMEAISGDGGTHNANGVWWLSPDITLVGPVSGLETADQGENKISIRFHRKAAGTCTFPGDESTTVQVWVGNPSLIMAPRVRGSAARVAFIGSLVPPEGGRHTQQLVWTPPVALPSPFLQDNPQQPGLKCLVAICYPDSQAPSETDFFVPGDQHVAQHNLSMVKTSAELTKFVVNTFNPAASLPNIPAPTNVKLRAVMDLAPQAFVRKMVLSRLQPFPEFQQLRTAPLANGFSFDLTGLQATGIVNQSQAGSGFPLASVPSFEAKVQIPASLTKVTFMANLKGVHPGEACIFHLTQTFKDLPQGGLTLVLLQT